MSSSKTLPQSESALDLEAEWNTLNQTLIDKDSTITELLERNQAASAQITKLLTENDLKSSRISQLEQKMKQTIKSASNKSDNASHRVSMVKLTRKTSHSKDMDSKTFSNALDEHRRKSLGIGSLRGVVTSALKSGLRQQTDSSAKSNRRLSFTNPMELQQRLQQDRQLGELMNRAQASRLDDQRGISSPSCFELPEFLKTDPTALGVSGPPLMNNQDNRSAMRKSKEDFVAPVGKPPQKPRRGVPKLGLSSPVYRSSVQKTALKAPITGKMMNMFDFV